MNQERLDALLDGLCAGSLTVDEVGELDALITAEPEVARHVARMCDLNRQLSEHLRPTSQRLPILQGPSALPGKRTTRLSRRRGSSRTPRLRLRSALPLALVGAVAAMIVVVLLLGQPATPERWLEGRADYASGGQIVPGQQLPAGTQMVAVSTAVLCFSDGTRVHLGDGTRLVLGEGPGKHLHLDRGRIQARVAKQPQGVPFQVRTGHTQVTVIGTVFTLAVHGARTELTVEEGAVRLHADGIDTLVTGGQQRVVDPTVPTAPTAPTTAAIERPALLVPRNAVWSYHDVGDPPDAGWRQLGFDDRHWRRGPAPLGYDRDEERAVFATLLHSEKPARMTAWFRHEFTCADPSQIRSLVIDLQRDDGVVVYLNGREIVRDNLPEGEITAQTRAVEKIDGLRQDEHRLFTIPADALHTGRNCIAAEVHQDSTGSTDLLFSLELRAEYHSPAAGAP